MANSVNARFVNPVAGATLPSDLANLINVTTDVGSSMVQIQVFYRVYGSTGAWSTSGVLAGTSQWNAPASTFAPGAWEMYAEGVMANPPDWRFYVWQTTPIVFNTQGASITPTITVPAGATVTTPTQTITWTTAPTTQDRYQVQVASDAAGTVVYYDTGEVTSANQTHPNTLFPDTGVTRWIRVRVRRSPLHAWSAWATKSVTVTHTPPVTPVIASLIATDVAGIGCLHALVATITQAAPGGGVPATTTTEVYARLTGDTSAGALIARIAGIATSFTWGGPTHGKQYEFRAKNISDDGRSAFSGWVIANSATTIRGVVLWDPSVAVSQTRCFRFNEEGAVEDQRPTSALIQYDGRRLPVVEFGIVQQWTIEVPTITLRDAASYALWTAVTNTRSIVLYRDRRGRKAYGLCVATPATDAAHGYVSGLTVTPLDYPLDLAP